MFDVRVKTSRILLQIGLLALAPAAAGTLVSASPGMPSDSPAPPGSITVELTDTLSFRSFLPESLIASRPVLRKPISTLWSATFVNRTPDIVSDLLVVFTESATLSSCAPFPEWSSTDGGFTWVVSGQSLAPGDSVTLVGLGPKRGLKIHNWYFGEWPDNPGFVPDVMAYLLPMPNSANFRVEVFEYGGFAPGTTESDELGGLIVGQSFLRFWNFRWHIDPDSARVFGWVRMQRQSALIRSLVYGQNHVTHTGIPRGFCVYDNGRPFVREVHTLPPVKMNNRLFAGLAALKMNIAASQLGITPAGFGELIYVDEGHPLNNMMVRRISAYADSMMTRCGIWGPPQFNMLDTVVRRINGAFSGPLDTVSFASGLVLTPVRSLRDVPFLRANSEVPPIRIPRVYMPDQEDGETESEDAAGPKPEVIQVAEAYPNPFNPATSIQFELQEFAYVTLKVYDMLGREVRTLAEHEFMFDGTNETRFDGAGLASGMYFFRITAESAEDPIRTSFYVGKLVLMK